MKMFKKLNFGGGKLLLLTLISLFSICAWGDDTYELVTSTSDLEAGSKYLIVSTEYSKALGTKNTNNRKGVSVTISDGTITLSSTNTDVTVLTLGGETDAWTFYDTTNSGYLYAASSSKNYLKTETTLDDNAKAKISISGDSAKIVFQGSYTRNIIRYNSTSSLFSCYNSGQRSVQLYKLKEDPSKCTAPTISPASGTVFSDKLEVSISCDEGDHVCYTTDESDPSESKTAIEYTAPFEISATTTVKAVALSSDGNSISDVVTAEYTKVDVLEGIKALKEKIKTDNVTSQSSAKTYVVNLTNAVVTKASTSAASVEQDGVGVYLYKSSHGYKAGDTFNGIATVTGYVRYGWPQVSSLLEGATKTSGEAPDPTVVSLDKLNNDFDSFDSRYIKVEKVEVASIDDRTTTISQSGNTFPVYAQTGVTSPSSEGDVIDVLGIAGVYVNSSSTTNQIYVYSGYDYVLDLDFTISPCGYSSLYYSKYNLVLPDDLTAYVISEFDEENKTLKAEEAYSSSVPKGQAVLVKGEAGKTYNITSTDKNGTAVTNLLVGTDTETKVSASSGKYLYYFGYGSDKTPGFFMDVAGGQSLTNYAHKAYIELGYNAEESDAKAISLDFGDVTAIDGIASKQQSNNSAVYTLSGVKVNSNNLQKGVYICNGRKFIVK